MRVSWDEYALRLAIVAASRSEDKWNKVGACALSEDNRVLGVAYNGLAAGKSVDEDFWKDRGARLPFMLHAEINLLSLFARREARLMAVTLLPCGPCARAICAWGFKTVIYGDMYHRDSEALDIFKFYGIELKEIKVVEK